MREIRQALRRGRREECSRLIFGYFPLVQMPSDEEQGAQSNDGEDKNQWVSGWFHLYTFVPEYYGCGGAAASLDKSGVPLGGGAEKNACASRLLSTSLLT